MVPTADLWYGPQDISIPKKIWSEKQGKYLSLQESLQYPHGCFRYARQFAAAGLRLIENSPEDIADLSSEMMSRLSAKNFTVPEDTLTSSMYEAYADERYTSLHSCSHLGAGYFRKHFILADNPANS
jgi:putative glycosyltransferase (TIGR04372 family)